jgi:hypothetical protein
MKENLLIKNLSLLTRKEMTRFNEFVNSPYFNKHKEVRALAGYLSSVYPHFDEKTCATGQLLNHLYPASGKTKAQLSVIFSYTLRLLEQFQRIEQLESEGFLDENRFNLRYLRDRNVFSFNKKFTGEISGGGTKKKATTPPQTKPAPLGSRQFEQRFRLLAEQDAHSLATTGGSFQLLQCKQPWLDAWYFVEKLRDGCELLQRSRLSGSPLQVRLFEKIISEIEAHIADYQAFPAVLAYASLFKLLQKPDDETYNNAYQSICKNESALHREDLQNMYNHLQNHCIEQINRGNRDYLSNLLEIYRSQLENELLLVEGFLPEWHFKNIVTTGLRLDETPWVQRFMEIYKEKLRPDVRENAFSFNYAAYHYHLRQFDQVLDLLLRVEYTDLRYNLDAKSLLLRTYYDIEEEEPLLSLIEAFRQFLIRNRNLTEFQKKGYFNLLKFTQKTFRLKMSKDFTPPAKWEAAYWKVKNEIANAGTIFNQTWIEGKLAELA